MLYYVVPHNGNQLSLSGDENEDLFSEPAKKKPKVSRKAAVSVKPRKRDVKADVRGKALKTAKKEKVKKEIKQKRVLTPEQIKNPNLLLVANNKIEIWDKDPFIQSR